ncbi:MULTISPECIES: plasmid partitioning protein RepB [Hyphomicrobiales]|uniref:plasmid partitioning protein RepB n=1 Tax=Hyphomicrobiales TaxID=356 RepID=UPI0004B30BDB|nr:MULTISPECIES: plasmid partitioning protein RepB [Hyphomicrobiales]MBS7743630.1 plasmid partitioning protein RepB [Chelatococcus sp. HY11]MCP9630008.1 plasmid partitioning protein RepB [Rhodopseudomonas palustris]CAH1662688.1 putative replication protein B [Hyphomicrobiales bacterium]MBX3546467.1 plasmid partitioning protein RepB [Chelatococcus sp.]MCO5153802.1 plasmid partitioning protein RepB [Shinella sp.]
MNKRRDQLKAMMAPITGPTAPSEDRPTRPPVSSGSLKAMGLSLKSLSDDADEAQALRAQLASGAQVVEIDPNLVDPAFIRDRLNVSDGDEFEAFKAGLSEDGQQVPILVRPRIDAPGRYQAAYGHRRVAALRALGRPVKAIVRELSDEELVVAQGKENTDRKDLSFIERALFAARLEDRGIARAAIMSALSVPKGNLSTMISLVRELPEDLIIAIGAAPKVGRPRWEQLATLVKQGDTKWRDVVSDANFQAGPSDARFERVLKALVRRPKKPATYIVKSDDGKQVARIERAKDQTRLTIDNRHAPDFGAYLVDQLPEIYAAFKRRADA